jgi:hypothetical protein
VSTGPHSTAATVAAGAGAPPPAAGTKTIAQRIDEALEVAVLGDLPDFDSIDPEAPTP